MSQFSPLKALKRQFLGEFTPRPNNKPMVIHNFFGSTHI